MSGFGRKGLEGQPPQQQDSAGQTGLEGLRNSARGAFQPQSATPAMSSRVDAFLAAERARPAVAAGSSQAGISDFAANYRDTAKPTRSLLMAYLMWFIAGQVSAHRFYLGAYRSAVAQVGLFVFWLVLVFGTPKGAQNAMGPVLVVVLVAWGLWVFGDVFFIRRLHRELCRQPNDAAAAFA